MFELRSIGLASLVVLGVLGSTVPVAHAGGGHVLPAAAQPNGYSLEDAAAATAHFYAGPRTDDTLPEDFPFQILINQPGQTSGTFVVAPGSKFYVPIVAFDDSDPILGDFPDVSSPEEVATYYFDGSQLGAEYFEIVVDGDVTSLDSGYTVGAETPGLPTGGDLWTVAAAFLTPMSRGTHTVTIRTLLTGDAFAEVAEYYPAGYFEKVVTYTVIVD